MNPGKEAWLRLACLRAIALAQALNIFESFDLRLSHPPKTKPLNL